METNNEELMSSSKEKPHPSGLLTEAEMKSLVFKEYQKEMEERKKEYYYNSGLEVNFGLAQDMIKDDEFINQVLNIAYFYDTNYTGNKEFMHIPDIKKVASNIMNFPVMLATRKIQDGSNEIIGITTIKYENNPAIVSNPIFPTKNENVLFITGMLTKNYDLTPNDVRILGIGKEMCKAAIRGAYNINKCTKTRIVCEIDCRNSKSINAVLKATEELNSREFGVSAYIVGYYELYNKQNKLIEAPTFIVEFEFDRKQNYNVNGDIVEFSYVNCKMPRLYFTKENIKYITAIEDGFAVYHDTKRININNIKLDVGNSADGNNRVPVLNPFVELIK